MLVELKENLYLNTNFIIAIKQKINSDCKHVVAIDFMPQVNGKSQYIEVLFDCGAMADHLVDKIVKAS